MAIIYESDVACTSPGLAGGDGDYAWGDQDLPTSEVAIEVDSQPDVIELPVEVFDAMMRRQYEARMMASGTDSMGLTHEQVEELITETNKYLAAVQEKIVELESTHPKFSQYIDTCTSEMLDECRDASPGRCRRALINMYETIKSELTDEYAGYDSVEWRAELDVMTATLDAHIEKQQVFEEQAVIAQLERRSLEQAA